MNAPADAAVLFRLGLADNPALTELVTHPTGDGCREVSLIVADMRCASCAERIRAALAGCDGATEVRINPARHHVAVEYDPERLSLGALVGAIESAGYHPTFVGADVDDPRLTAERRAQLKRLGVAGIAMMQVMMFSIALYAGAMQDMTPLYEQLFRWSGFVFATPVVLYSAQPFFSNALASLKQWFGATRVRGGLAMDVPVSLAILAAYVASCHATFTGSGDVYFDSVTMFTFFLLGARYLEQGLRHRLARFDNLLSMLPETATRLREHGADTITVSQIRAGDRILIAAGGRVPCDGIVLGGESEIDESPLTGESALVAKRPGERVYAGTLNVSQLITVHAKGRTSETRMAHVQRLAERAAMEKTPIVAVTDRVAKHFVLAVLVIAAGACIAWLVVEPSKALWATIAVLVVSCPCALSLATPAAITAATMALRRRGFVVTRADVLERLANATDVVFDKTGTLTGAAPELVRAEPCAELDADACSRIAAALEQHANHPLARAFVAAVGDGETIPTASQVRSHPGRGIEGMVAGTVYRIGRPDFCGVSAPSSGDGRIRVHLSSNGRHLAWFALENALRPDASETVRALGELGLRAVVLSGDAAEPCRVVSEALGVPVEARMSPEAKLAAITRLEREGRRVLMVGDGINDVPGLSAATVSVTPLEATDLARNSSDALMLSAGLAPLVDAIRLSRRTRAIVRQNLGWALVYNVTALPLAALGLIAPWVAALGMSASSLLVVLNAMRLARPDRLVA